MKTKISDIVTDLMILIGIALIFYSIGYKKAGEEYKKELNTCKGMNRTYLEENQNLKERCNEIEQDNMELSGELNE